MPGGVFFVFFAVLFSSYGLANCKLDLFREAEIALGEAMHAPGLVVRNPRYLTHEQIEAEDRRVLKYLDHIGIEYEAVPAAERLTHRWRTYLAALVDSGQVRVDEGTARGNLYRIRATRPSIYEGPMGYTLQHGRLGEVRKELLAAGDTDLLLDSSLGLTGAAAYFYRGGMGDRPFVGIWVDGRINDVDHEATHAKFSHCKIHSLIKKIRARVKRGEDVSGELKKYPYRDFGESRLRDLVRLIANGYPDIAINEWFATRTEIQLMRVYGMAYEEQILRSDRYARAHLLSSLGELATRRRLTLPERISFVSALAYYGLSDPVEKHDVKTLDAFRHYRRTLEDPATTFFKEANGLTRRYRAWKSWLRVELAGFSRRRLQKYKGETLERLHPPAP